MINSQKNDSPFFDEDIEDGFVETIGTRMENAEKDCSHRDNDYCDYCLSSEDPRDVYENHKYDYKMEIIN